MNIVDVQLTFQPSFLQTQINQSQTDSNHLHKGTGITLETYDFVQYIGSTIKTSILTWGNCK
jgi:hypothetical protein